MLSSSSGPVEHSQQLRRITLKGDHSFAEQFSYWLLLGKENEYEAWTFNGHASFTHSHSSGMSSTDSEIIE